MRRATTCAAPLKLLVNTRNVGFSAGCNQGALAASRPEVLVSRALHPHYRDTIATYVQGLADVNDGGSAHDVPVLRSGVRDRVPRDRALSRPSKSWLSCHVNRRQRLCVALAASVPRASRRAG